MNPKRYLAVTTGVITLVLIYSIYSDYSNKKLKNGSGELSYDLPILGKIQEFNLIDQNGEFFNSSKLKGSTWIAAFIFTRCPTVCPMMMEKMSKLQNYVSDNDNITFVSITVDPEHDKPEILLEFSKKFTQNYKKWYFLTGEKKNIYDLAKNAFNLPVGKEPDMHSTRFVLVDKNLNIRKYFDTEVNKLENLIKLAKSLNKEGVI